jgi:5-methylcytosine-specific restriction enzyme A
MPKAPPRPCPAPRCRNMITKKGRCDDHQPIAWASSIGKTPTERGYGYKWTKLRKSALVRDNHLCQDCLKRGILTPATEVDHILNKARGGADIMENLQSLCKPCHKAKTQRERTE